MPKKVKAAKNAKSKRTKKDDDMQIKVVATLKEDQQEYGKVIKLLGNRRVECACFDGKTRICRIRPGLKRQKQFVMVDSIVLISLRNFQDEKADILTVYTVDQVKKLRKMAEIPLEATPDGAEMDDIFIRGGEDGEENETVVKKNEPVVEGEEESDESVDFDLI
jgi:translation initiation factor 1A